MKKTYIFEAKHLNEVRRLNKRLGLIDNIKSDLKFDNNKILLCIDILSDKEETFDNITVLIGSLVLSLYKSDYIAKNLFVPPILNSSKDLLTVSLVAFDYETELLYISNLLLEYDTVNALSFYLFCLDNLRTKWAEFVSVINMTLRLENTDGFIELIKFLSQNTNGTNELNLHIVGGKILLCDHNQNVIEQNIDIDDTITLITLIANHTPKVINVHNLNVLGKRNYKILNYVFPNKLNTLV